METSTTWIGNFGGSQSSFRLNDLCGCEYWKRLLGSCLPDKRLDELFQMPKTYIYLLCGAAGNGKQTLALALAGNLKEYGYEFIHIPGAALAGKSENAASENINSLFQEIMIATELGKGYYIFLDNLASICEKPMAVWTLVQGIQQLEEADRRCVLTATIENAETVPEYLKKVMMVCPVEAPTKEERKVFLNFYFQEMIPKAGDFPVETMADMTEGFNYAQLTRLTLISRMLLKQQAQEKFGGNYEKTREAVEYGRLAVTKKQFESIVRQLEKPKTNQKKQEISEGGINKEITMILKELANNRTETAVAQPAVNSKPNKEKPRGFRDNFLAMDMSGLNL